jgi:hypothetical protein
MLRSRRLAALAPRDWRVGLAPFVVWAAGRVSRVRRATRRLRRARRRDSAGRWARCSFELAGMQDGPPVRYRTRSLRSSCRTQDTGGTCVVRPARRRARSVTCKSIVLLILYLLRLEIKHGALVVGCRAQRNRDGRCGAACASSLVTRRPPAPVRVPVQAASPSFAFRKAER